ncbi:hypothetical protein [Pseudomonas sp. CFBP 13719]|uniref:hypothetical protein n=1 Tax=Pseudomonas sp. CFBP 13719 TaxID=2775303 RepID=UPI00177CFBB0|nr:hypothetical protein [Pseudomonas sp. CFBP 13719]MBD8680343.1 hypothetical protein [Pseudomonas sp. CFBP 13719]
MRRKATSERELADAINSGADEIEIEGDLCAKVVKIKAKGKVAWLIAFGALSIAAGSAIAAFKIHNAKAKAAAASGTLLLGSIPAVSLGPVVATSAIKIATFAGRTSALNELREYKIKERNAEFLILARK